MDLGLKDKVAIVGGSSRGIGRAIAIALAKEGASVTICARNEAALRTTEIELARIASQRHVLAIPADLSVERDIRRVVRDTFNRFDQVGILVSHVGNADQGPSVEFEDANITQAFEANLLSAVRLAREVIPHMKQQHWGRIINLLSPVSLQAVNNMGLSTATQMAVIGYFKTLANELGPFNITVNNIVSGDIDTEQFSSRVERQSLNHNGNTEEFVKNIISQIPIGRIGKPEEIGDLVAFVASERSGFVTGTSIIADGGAFQGVK
jgi:3-oxoacyl-[acyl-carrier protein] reductase